MTSEKISLAVEIFKSLHRDQKRKDNVRPYFVHLEDVARRLIAVGVTDEDVIVAAYGHDSLEDLPKNPAEFEKLLTELRIMFGFRATDFILELTDQFTKKKHPDKNRATRKQLERERYATFSPGAKLVKLADIAANLSDTSEVLENGKPEQGFNGMFGREKALCLPYLKDESDKLNVALYKEAEEILRKHRLEFHY
jgi:(p)ppGpp synthase/HD superfamily hydrolase